MSATVAEREYPAPLEFRCSCDSKTSGGDCRDWASEEDGLCNFCREHHPQRLVGKERTE